MKAGFDTRIVSYENIHSIAPTDWNKLLKAINPQPNEIILDGMCGYGAVGKGILEKEKSVYLFLSDESEVQIERAMKNLPKISKSNFSIDSFPKSKFKENFFDKVVIKMGLHEVPKKEQLNVVKEAKRILKPKGKFIIWDIMLNSQTQSLFQDVIRKKDKLSGFETLTRERYFFREEEFLETMKKAKFSKIKENDDIEAKIIGKRYELNDPYISIIAELYKKKKKKLILKKT